MDVEVIIKRALVYAAAVAAIAAMYAVLLKLAREAFFERATTANNSVIALLATLVVVLLSRPVKNAIQTGLDRVLLPRSLRLSPCARRVRARPEQRSRSVAPQRAAGAPRHGDARRRSHGAAAGAGGRRTRGRVRHHRAHRLRRARRRFLPAASEVGRQADRRAHADARRSAGAAAARRPAEVDFWREAGIHYFVPCVSKEGTIAVMALGRKASAEPLSSEDMALLAAVAAQAATALENGRLYRAASGQGRRARADARVQREYPGVAERRPRRRQPRRSDRSLEPPARRAVRRSGTKMR